jgi:drug/metabolite transporter (DMT)-like permease
MKPGLIGGIAGGVLGLAGAIVGTYFSIKNTNGIRERAFMVKASVVCWIAGILFLVLMFALPDPYRYLLWILYAIFLPLGILFCNRTQERIRKEESQNQGLPG